MSKTSCQIELASNGAHNVILTLEDRADTRAAIAWARATPAQLSANDSVRPPSALEEELEQPGETIPACPAHERRLAWLAKGQRGPFWRCHERDEHGSWCTYTQEPGAPSGPQIYMHLANVDGRLSPEARALHWTRALGNQDSKQVSYVAEQSPGQVVGFASGGPERTADPIYRGELYAIYILPDHQRAGLGRQLTARIVQRLADSEITAMLVWVLAANPWRKFAVHSAGRRPLPMAVARGCPVIRP